jgi:GNAT superfamily N-acetyltransferase
LTELIVFDTADEARREFLSTQLREFNNIVSPAHRMARAPGQIRPYDVYAFSESGEIVAGMATDTYWDWWEVRKLWVHESLRGQGLGSAMMALGEAEALRRGCRHAYLTTYSFQAPDFYTRLGFRIVGRLDDYPFGAAFLWLRKELKVAG